MPYKLCPNLTPKVGSVWQSKKFKDVVRIAGIEPGPFPGTHVVRYLSMSGKSGGLWYLYPYKAYKGWVDLYEPVNGDDAYGGANVAPGDNSQSAKTLDGTCGGD